jgi:hypothetical protein
VLIARGGRKKSRPPLEHNNTFRYGVVREPLVPPELPLDEPAPELPVPELPLLLLGDELPLLFGCVDELPEP